MTTNDTKTFLITGGAGFLGINLVRYLLKKGCKVISLDIAPFDYDDCKDKIISHQGDIRKRHDVLQAMTNEVDVVVHCAAALPLYKPDEIYSTDVDGTETILSVAAELNINRVVHISSTAVYGVPDHHPLLETSPMIGVGDYGKAKIKAEAICLKYQQKGLTVPILRPKSFIGPERLGIFAMFYEWAKDGHHFPILGSGRNRYQLLDVEDLCNAIWLSATLPDKAVKGIFNIGAEVYTTLKEDFQSVLDCAGKGKRIIPLPSTPAVMVLKVLELLSISPVYQWIYDTMSKDSYVSIEKAKAQLGFAPKYSNKDALTRNYQWYLTNFQNFEKNNSGVSHRVPWSMGALRIAKWFF